MVYEDDTVVVAVKDLVYTPGQITIFPRQHFTILEQVPDEIVSRCTAVADKASRAVFDVFKAEGTNILVQNGLGAGQKVPHFAIEVIPRREGDGLNLQWQPKEMGQDDLDIAAHQLSEEAAKLGDFTAPKKEAKEKERKPEHKLIEKGENYLSKSLKRIP